MNDNVMGRRMPIKKGIFERLVDWVNDQFSTKPEYFNAQHSHIMSEKSEKTPKQSSINYRSYYQQPKQARTVQVDPDENIGDKYSDMRDEFQDVLAQEDERHQLAVRKEKHRKELAELAAEREEMQLRVAMQRVANKQAKKALVQEREDQAQAERMLKWLVGHANASQVAGASLEMAGLAMTKLKLEKDLLKYIREKMTTEVYGLSDSMREAFEGLAKMPHTNNPMDIYSAAIDALVAIANGLDGIENIVVDGWNKMDEDDKIDRKLY